jgi:hypothetical protein
MGGTLYQDIPTQRADALRHRMQALYDRNCHATSWFREPDSRSCILVRRW